MVLHHQLDADDSGTIDYKEAEEGFKRPSPLHQPQPYLHQDQHCWALQVGHQEVAHPPPHQADVTLQG